MQPTGETDSVYFYPRPPRGGRRKEQGHCLLRQDISIHALREEGDLWLAAGCARPQKFLSTPSARRATLFDGL